MKLNAKLIHQLEIDGQKEKLEIMDFPDFMNLENLRVEYQVLNDSEL